MKQYRVSVETASKSLITGKWEPFPAGIDTALDLMEQLSRAFVNVKNGFWLETQEGDYVIFLAVDHTSIEVRDVPTSD